MPDSISRRQRRTSAQQVRRAAETPEASSRRLSVQNVSDRRRSRSMSQTELDSRRNRNRISHARRRENESIQARSTRLLGQLTRHAHSIASRSFQLNNAGFSYDRAIEYADEPLISIGELDRICEYCAASCFDGETAGLCCARGKVKVDLFPPPPEPIATLFSGDYHISREFLKMVRRYNACFQMTSFGVTGQQDDSWSTFRIQGQIYHRIGSLYPMPDEEPSFLQIYFMGDSDAQVDRRLAIFQGLSRQLVPLLQQFLESQNRLIREFTSNLEQNITENESITIRGDVVPSGHHVGRYNEPVQEEDAIFVVGDQATSKRDVVIRSRSDILQFISEFSPIYDALQYPLILWKGQPTYHFNLREINPSTGLPTRTKVSMMDYYAHQLMIRRGDSNFVLKLGHLLNQFVVDMYTKVESERLQYFRREQSRLRREDYIHLRDGILNECASGDSIGLDIILPSSFIGSPRHMKEYAQDSLTYVRKYGTADFFITFTCNPQWPEIKKLLMSTQDANCRHDIVARVFRQKIIKFMKVLTTYKLFGPTRCFTWTAEWQKRGLPHIHLLLWLENKLRPNQIDHVVCAELPDPEQDPQLFNIVRRNMIHGPCGPLYPNSTCMREVGSTGRKVCSKKLPKRFVAETQSDNDGYPLYRRRAPNQGGHSFSDSNGRTIDNSSVVPYNPVLLRMFNAHINVEHCNSVKAIKYICKYIHKGSDAATFSRQRDGYNDEITNFQHGRYLSSNEAFWRIFGFPIHDRHPAVTHLAVHLENGQRVYFRPDNAENIALNPPNTTLTAFFELCRADTFAQTLLYSEVPTYYTWNAQRKIFNRRVRGNEIDGHDGIRASETLGRMYTVHPNQGECFYLRLLLTKVRGPTSFEDLRTHEGTIHTTYRAACEARGLLESDNHWETTLLEASEISMPSQIRTLFAIMLCFCSISNPLRLWELFKQAMSDDILRRLRLDNPELSLDFNDPIYNESLIMIEDICVSMVNKSLSDLGIPSPDRTIANPLESEILRETSYDSASLQAFIEENLPKLVADQRFAFDTLTHAIHRDEGGMFFLDAPGGTGKTFLLNLLLAYVRKNSQIILAVASSGIAATLLDGGRTSHSALKLPLNINPDEYPVCDISRRSAKGRMLCQCKAIVWDECTMSHKKSLEAVDRTLRCLRNSNRPFGGVVVFLAGDFRQTLPVIKRRTQADEINACLKQSRLWRHVQKLTLSTNMRALLRGGTESSEFSRLLLSIGDGTYPSDPISQYVQLSEGIRHSVNSREELIEKVFPDLQSNLHDHDWLFARGILATTNIMVDEINALIQEKISNQLSRFYYSIDTTIVEQEMVEYPTELLNSISLPGLPSHELILRVGSPIMLMRNSNPPKLCNGTKLRIKSLQNNIIEATILSGKYKNEDVFIPRIPLEETDAAIQFRRLRFPVKLAYSFTVNKARGQSLSVVGFDLTSQCFSHEQLYVALSRAGRPSDIFAHAPNGHVRNVVYQQALR